MDVRGRRLRQQDKRTTEFISSITFDGEIAKEVLRVNRAHMMSLIKEGEVERTTGVDCLRFLSEASPTHDKVVPVEDYHQLLEQAAVDALGVDTAGYLNLGKSRNDQVVTAIRIHLKRLLLQIIANAIDLQRSITIVARKQGRIAFPGYTHMQHAQPVTLAHHMFAYFDCLGRDIERLFQLYERADASPMGSAALAGTSVRVSRTEVAGLLGFGRTMDNAMDAVSSRDVELEALACFSVLMSSLSRISEELVIWTSREFSFAVIPDEFSATSSIMPQKKNPVVAELVRAKSGSVLGALSAGLSIVKGLPYSYSLDLQEVTPHLWRAAADVSDSLHLLAALVRGLRFDNAAIAKSLEGDFSTATSLANYLVGEHDVSFRQAHAIVGAVVRNAVEEGSTLEDAAGSRLVAVFREETGRTISVPRRTIRSILSIESSLNKIVTTGGSNPAFIAAGLVSRTKSIGIAESRLNNLRSVLDKAEKTLDNSVESLAQEVKKS